MVHLKFSKVNITWWRISFNVTFKIHIVLKSLAQSWTWNGDHRREFNFQIDISTITTRYTVVSDTVISSTILLTHSCDFHDVAIPCTSTCWQECIVLTSPDDSGSWISWCIAFHLNILTLWRDNRLRWVIWNNWRSSHWEQNVCRNFVIHWKNNFTLICSSISLELDHT